MSQSSSGMTPVPASCPECEDVTVTAPTKGVWRITLGRPKVKNALRSRTLADIAAVLAAAESDDSVRAVVLTGGDEVFAAGADIGELAAHDADTIRVDPRVGHWQAIKAFKKPLIAAVNGFALGGGCELAMHADIIIAGSNARFGQPEVNLGIMPGAGGTQRLTRALGKSKSMLLNMTGAFLTAEAAERGGLVAEVTQPELTIERATAIAALIASKPPLAVQAIKQAVLTADETGLTQGLGEERAAFCDLFTTDDKQEGVTAFLEKRKPRFTGR